MDDHRPEPVIGKRIPVMPRVGLLLALLLVPGPLAMCGLAGPPALKTALDSISLRELKSHVQFLASDALEGREAGTTGAWAASKYILEQVRQVKELQPGDDDLDWLQVFNGNFRNLPVVFPGSDPELKNEYILIGAHYDHVGYGSRSNSRGPTGFVHNGADDNASGTAALIEVLEALAEVDPPPRRSILAVFWDGEEKGLVGSEFFVRNPTVPLEKIRLALNSDMIGRLGQNGLGLYGWRTAAGMRQFLVRQNTSELPLNFSWEYQRDSDHWPFFERNIPSLMLHTGKHSDYHRPSDDVDKLNLAGLQQIARYLFQLTVAAGSVDELPTFRSGSRPEVSSLARLRERYSKTVGWPSRFGVSYHGEVAGREKRVIVTRIEAGSPAQTAGLQPDDEILKIGGRAVVEAPDFRVLVLTSPSETAVRFRRGETELTTKVKLRGAPVSYGFEWRTDDAEPQTVIVTAVMPGSIADLAGLKKGHRILSVGAAPPGDREEFRRQLRSAKDTVRFEVEAAGRLAVLNLQKFPPD